MTGEQHDGSQTDPIAPVDLRQVRSEIDQEVRQKRASGELPEDFERQLDRSFAKFAPVDALSGDLPTLIDKLEQSTIIDTKAPTESSRPGVAQVKAAVAKAIDWDLRHLSSQVSGLAHALTRAVGMLAERVYDLELDASSAIDEALIGLGPGPQRAALPEGDWTPVALAALAGVGGRVLHTECGAGGLVAALRAAGADVYGVEPDPRLALEAPAHVADIRIDTARAHLRLLATGSLGGVVLSGCVDRLAPGALLDLIDVVRARLAVGGRLVMISHHPQAWAARRPNLASDLAGGRPWHPDTWQSVLEARGFDEVEVHDGPPSPQQLELTGGPGPDTVRFDAAITAVNQALFGPDGFAVSATR